MEVWMPGAVVVSLAVVASWFDVREHRVPNLLTVPALGMGLLIALFGGLGALGSALAGAALCLAFGLPFFLVGGLGGGDVKLMTAFGAFLGPQPLVGAMIVMALAGGGMALVEMIRHGAVARTFANLWVLRRTLGRGTFTGWKREGSEAWLTLKTPGAIAVPYAVAISAGALFGWFT